MKRLLIVSVAVLVLVSVMTMPAAARWRAVDQRDQAVAWLEDDILFVAVANEGHGRERFHVEPVSANRTGQNPFERRTMIIGAMTVMLDSIPISDRWQTRWDGEITEIIVDGPTFGRITVPVQRSVASMDISNFIAPADTMIEVDIDLMSLLEGRDLYRLVVDSDYRIIGTSRVGRISVSSFSGGFQYSSTRNEITYRKPLMTLRMRTPMIRDIGLLTFDITHFDERSRREVMSGPIVLVYGTDYRFVDNTTTAPSTRTVR